MGREYQVEYVESLDAYGYCNVNAHLIQIDDGQDTTEEADTLVHEIFHALMFYMDIGLGAKKEEHVVRKLATGFTQVFRDNPHLLAYLANA